MARESELLLRPGANPPSKHPHEHQRAAWEGLSRHYGAGHEAGLVVIPTGGGKTFVATHWLLEHHVRQGGRVLWLAHRRSLLRQAMEEFERLADVAYPKAQLGLIRISSKDSRWSRVDQNFDVVFSSLQTAIQEGTRGFIERFVEEAHGGVIVVIDEAHHAAAPSYAALIRWLRDRSARLLGLTATPVRVDRQDQLRLHELFDASLIYQVPRRTLTERGFLAAPSFETVQTEVELEREFTEEDFKHLRRFGDLAPRVLEKLARHSHRNELIAKHYAARRYDYGSTIVFAVDSLHAQTLAEAFKRTGVDADYVDYTRTDAAQVMQAYRERRRPTVLVNVEMLTEGFDAPHTKTVFIARPTRSEGLLMQMVGRALRGKIAGGNERAHLVTFLDTWEHFQVLDAKYVLEGGEAEERDAKKTAAQEPAIPIPHELVLEVYRLLVSVTRGAFVGVHECLPHGWYSWEQVYDNDLQRRVILVFENQREGFEQLLSAFDVNGFDAENLDAAVARRLISRYFGDLPDPQPRWEDVLELLEATRAQTEVLYYSFEEKAAFDPCALALDFANRDLTVTATRAELQRLWESNPTLRHVYRGEFRTWADEIQREQSRLWHPADPAPPPQLVRLVPEKAPRPWAEGEMSYSLLRIKEAVTVNVRNFPQGAPEVREIVWSTEPMGGAWSFWRESDRTIKINRILDSPDIPLFALEFLLYRELLRAQMPSGGEQTAFRLRERAFTPSSKAVDDAARRDVVPGSAHEAWRVLSVQFFATFDRYFLTKRSPAPPVHALEPLY